MRPPSRRPSALPCTVLWVCDSFQWARSLLNVGGLQMSHVQLSPLFSLTWIRATPTGHSGVRTNIGTGSLEWSLHHIFLCCHYNSVLEFSWMSRIQTSTNLIFTCITALLHAVVRWQWFPRQSDPFSRCMSLTRFHPRVTSMALNLEQLESLVKSDNTVTFVHSSLAMHPG